MKKDDFTVFIIIVIIRQWDERGMEWRYQSAASISDLPQNGLCLSFGHHSKSFMDLLTVPMCKVTTPPYLHHHQHRQLRSRYTGALFVVVLIIILWLYSFHRLYR